MWPSLVLMSDSMYLRAFWTMGSFGPTLPVCNRPVTTMPVTPGACLPPQEPSLAWVERRKLMALSTVASHSLGSGPTFFGAAEAGERRASQVRDAASRAARDQRVNIASYSAKGSGIRAPHREQTGCRAPGGGGNPGRAAGLVPAGRT